LLLILVLVAIMVGSVSATRGKVCLPAKNN